MKLTEGNAEQKVPAPQGGQAPVTWRIEATRIGTFDIEVTSSSGTTQKKKIVIRDKSIF
jgi:hypothetical protein